MGFFQPRGLSELLARMTDSTRPFFQSKMKRYGRNLCETWLCRWDLLPKMKSRGLKNRLRSPISMGHRRPQVAYAPAFLPPRVLRRDSTNRFLRRAAENVFSGKDLLNQAGITEWTIMKEKLGFVLDVDLGLRYFLGHWCVDAASSLPNSGHRRSIPRTNVARIFT